VCLLLSPYSPLPYFCLSIFFCVVVLSSRLFCRKSGLMGEDGWWWWRERERSALTQSKHMRAPSLGGVCSCVHLVTGYADQWQSSNGVVLFRFDASLISRVVVAVAIRFLIHSRK
jgi:hypothetical protein